MITAKDLRKKAQSLYDKPLFRSKLIFGDNSEFPISISLRPPSSKVLLDEFSSFSNSFASLIDESKQKTGYGYEISYKDINSRNLGKQRIPKTAIFNCDKDFLKFLRKEKEIEKYKETARFILEGFPSLLELLKRKPDLLEIDLEKWKKFIAVCEYFLKKNTKDVYLRSFEIEGVDTKFIESNKVIISLLLDETLPVEHIDKSIILSNSNGFEKRYRLRYDRLGIRIRLLDDKLRLLFHGFSDIQITIDELERFEIPCTNVLIIENKMNGLVIPDIPSSIVIFGLGNGISSLKNVNWLRGKKVAYWGDIDTWAFSILANLRQHFPHIESILMDEITFSKFHHLRTGEQKKSELYNDSLLTEEEVCLYKKLLRQTLTENTRLEQERLPLSYCLSQIINWANS